MTKKKPEYRIKVGDWWYLPELDKLVKLGPSGHIKEIADLDNLCQNVINYLIIRQGKLVSKSELLEEVWGVRSVTDGRITRVISVLRLVLGDDIQTPKYIETIPKRGYRLLAVVEPDTKLRPKLTLFVSFILIPILLALTLWFTSREQHESPAVPLWSYEPVTFLDGIEFYHSVSPDEQHLAFSYAESSRSTTVKLKLLNIKTNQVVTLTDDIYSSFGAAWSPDGTQLAYHRMLSGELCEIRLLSLNSSKDGVESNQLITACGIRSVSARLTWSPNGNYLVYPSREEGQNQHSLMMISTRGGQPESLSAPPPQGFGDYSARFSRDGNRLTFLRDNADSIEIWYLNLVTRSSRFIKKLDKSSPGNVDWSLDDREIVYPAGRKTLGAINPYTLDKRVVAYTNRNANELQISSSGNIYASVGAFSQRDIIKISNSITNSAIQSNQLVFSSNQQDSFAEANPQDKGPVAIISSRSGLQQVWLLHADGRQQQITDFSESVRITQLSFSPNGRHLLALINQQIWLLCDSEPPMKISLKADGNVTNPSWGVDGKTIYYASYNNGQWQMMTTQVQNLEQLEVYSFDMELYIEAKNGKYSFWKSSHNRHYYLQPMNGGPAKRIHLPINSALPMHFVLTGQGLYFSDFLSNNDYRIMYYDFQTKAIDVASGEIAIPTPHFSITANEEYFYTPTMSQGDLDIAVISSEQQGI